MEARWQYTWWGTILTFLFWAAVVMVLFAVWDTILLIFLAGAEVNRETWLALPFFLLFGVWMLSPFTLCIGATGRRGDSAAIGMIAIYTIAGFVAVALLAWVFPCISWLKWLATTLS